ncbi:hypothetical protein O9H85_33710 [Paenibacillus filicis]|uniref:Uncharacterized protein n=1 Tax=Paenibacillus gyeongsangnamensis TaxID=3388067 RepID=A0ABT4QK50_9BACL|nr:hypothetical protein [Paenibacillus filicis]MCZ8517220.1 hypothetical protein [Paenibacillus filicis]
MNQEKEQSVPSVGIIRFAWMTIAAVFLVNLSGFVDTQPCLTRANTEQAGYMERQACAGGKRQRLISSVGRFWSDDGAIPLLEEAFPRRTETGTGKRNWGYPFRTGHFDIDREDSGRLRRR